MSNALILAFLSGTLIGFGIGIPTSLLYFKKKTEKQMEQAMGELGDMFNPEKAEEK